jgi:hypothetical protein
MQLLGDELDQMESRHDAQMLTGRAAPIDPYAAWLQERESERRYGIVSAPTTRSGRFVRNRPARAPWDAMPVTLSPDSSF